MYSCATSYIAPDLFRGIVEYVAIVDLRDLSRASPIFDALICKVVPKIVYHGNSYIVVKDADIVIKDSTGTINVLQSTDYGYIGSNGYKYHIHNIVFEDHNDPDKKYVKDIYTGLYVHLSEDEITIYRGIPGINLYGEYDVSVFLDKMCYISFDVHIDMNTRYIMSTFYDVVNNYHYIYIVSFKVIVANNKWHKTHEN